MNLIDEYNSMVNNIEEYCKIQDGEYLSPLAITYKIADNMNMEYRALMDVFKFLTKITPIQYVKERKMMLAYQYICNTDDFDPFEAAEIAGYEHQSSFITAFKKTFNLSPTKIQKQKKYNLYKGPKTWEVLIEMEPAIATVKEPKPEKPIVTIMGIEEDQFRQFRKIDNLRAAYGFSDYLANQAYLFSNEHGYGLEKTFAYFNEFTIFGTDEYKTNVKEDLYDEKYPNEVAYYEGDMKKSIEDPNHMYMFFDKNMLEDYPIIEERLEILGIDDIKTLTDTELLFLACEEMHASYCMRAAEYYDRHGKYFDQESILEFIEEVCESPSIEEALEYFYPEHIFIEDVTKTDAYYDDDFSDIDAYMCEHHPDEYF